MNQLHRYAFFFCFVVLFFVGMILKTRFIVASKCFRRPRREIVASRYIAERCPYIIGKCYFAANAEGMAELLKCRDARSVRPNKIFCFQLVARTHEPCVPTRLAKIAGNAPIFLSPTGGFGCLKFTNA